MRRGLAWTLVALQLALLVTLALLPRGTLWPVGPALFALSAVLGAAAIVVVAVGLHELGAALTASPIPRERAELVTTGLYGRVRHPVYSGLLVGGLAFVVIGASGWHVGTWLALLLLLAFKARWEERMLIASHQDYRGYAARVGRFVPGIGRIRP